MRTNEEFTKAVYERRDDFLEKRKSRRKKIAVALSPLVICLIVFSAVVLPSLDGQHMRRAQSPALKSSGPFRDVLEQSSVLPDGPISVPKDYYNNQDIQDVQWGDFYFTEDRKNMYDTISVGKLYKAAKDEALGTSDKIEYGIWLTKGDETIIFVMAEDSLYYNGEYCRQLDDTEIEYLLSLSD